MKNNQYTILVIDDEKSIRRLLEKELQATNRQVILASCGGEALKLGEEYNPEVIIMDLRLPDIEDLDLLSAMREKHPYSEIIMVTGHGDIDTAVRAIKFGSCEFIQKPFDLDRLDLLVEKAHIRAKQKHERNDQEDANLDIDFIGKSADIEKIRYLVERVAQAQISVLLTGESGAGKDVIAQMIHQKSQRSQQPMVIKNCATIQKELASNELFGHAKGAFTGADNNYDGLLAHADGGTLFLDEIGELPLAVQAALLRVLETQSYRRIGEKEENKVDIRFIFATNRDLYNGDGKERFNEAFRNRINAFQINVPPLRERKEDLPLLIPYFLSQFASNQKKYQLSDAAMNILLNYDWPGNVRELRNIIERAVILSESELITKQNLPTELLEGSEDIPTLSLEAVEREHILKILQFHDGNRQKTAEMLGINRKTLYRKLGKFGIE